MSDIVFLNHYKSQCGIHEIGKRIHGLLWQGGLETEYIEVPVDGMTEYIVRISESNPSKIIYNYYPGTMTFLNKSVMNNFPHIKHYGVIHDPLDPPFVASVEDMFDAWIIHDQTNPIPSDKKFTTFRPIPRYERKEFNSDRISIGSHGFNCSPWKMFGKIIKVIQNEFDEVDININIPKASFATEAQNNFHQISEWHQSINKPGVNLNITNDYFETENDLIEFLNKNDMNAYFYNPPGPYVGVGGSADLAVASQSSLVVNDTYMYKHFHEALGFYNEEVGIKSFLKNKDKVQKLYEEWSPQALAEDYKKMIS
jgi:hypothetical protein